MIPILTIGQTAFIKMLLDTITGQIVIFIPGNMSIGIHGNSYNYCPKINVEMLLRNTGFICCAI